MIAVRRIDEHERGAVIRQRQLARIGALDVGAERSEIETARFAPGVARDIERRP